MKSSSDRIDHLRIASPCPMNWEQMKGDDRTRFCELCSFHVYNISEMTRKEVASLIESTEGRICGRIYRRFDGTIITKDCPVGLRAIRRRMARTAGAVFATIVGLGAVVMGQSPDAKDKAACRQQVTITRKVTDSPNVNGVIAGTVFDPNDAVVPGARITITDPKTKKAIETESSSEGRFLVAGLPAGSYDVTINSPGFINFDVKDVALAAKETVTFDLIVLSPQALTGIVSVIPPEPSLLDRSPSNKMTFSGDLIRRLPH